ncbi:MAG: rhodanese-like domain-containing protein [Firmicutes bacterium]|nr:rhodanese-like domain-containing protein [Bacillota bacterium]
MDKTETGSISSEDLAAALEAGKPLVIVDVRQPEQYQAGHLPGAVNIPLVDLWDRRMELDPTKDIITYCNSGNSGGTAKNVLLSLGFRSVCNLEGGYNGWKALKGLG